MTNALQKQQQLTIAQYLIEVIENKVIYQPNEKFNLFIDSNEFKLIKQKNQTEHEFYKYVLKAYIESFYNKIDEFNQINQNDIIYKRQVYRTLNRLINTFKKQYKKADISINWHIQFYMPVYGIDVYRQNLEQKKGLIK